MGPAKRLEVIHYDQIFGSMGIRLHRAIPYVAFKFQTFVLIFMKNKSEIILISHEIY